MMVRAKSKCDGFYMHQGIWLKLMNKYPGIKAQINIDAINFYEKIWKLVNMVKNKIKKKMLRRKDYQHVITLEDPDLLLNMEIWRRKELKVMKSNKSLKRE